MQVSVLGFPERLEGNDSSAPMTGHPSVAAPRANHPWVTHQLDVLRAGLVPVAHLAKSARHNSLNRFFFSLGYDPFTHICKIRPLTDVA